jgi:hypothetical protein
MAAQQNLSMYSVKINCPPPNMIVCINKQKLKKKKKKD